MFAASPPMSLVPFTLYVCLFPWTTRYVITNDDVLEIQETLLSHYAFQPGLYICFSNIIIGHSIKEMISVNMFVSGSYLSFSFHTSTSFYADGVPTDIRFN